MPTTSTFTATNCNTLQNTAIPGSGGKDAQMCGRSQLPQPSLKYSAAHCNTLQHTAIPGAGGKDTQMCGGNQ